MQGERYHSAADLKPQALELLYWALLVAGVDAFSARANHRDFGVIARSIRLDPQLAQYSPEPPVVRVTTARSLAARLPARGWRFSGSDRMSEEREKDPYLARRCSAPCLGHGTRPLTRFRCQRRAPTSLSL